MYVSHSCFFSSDIAQVVRFLLTSKPLARGGTLLQVRTIFGVSRRSDVYRLIRETGKGKISYARGLIKFLWRIGLDACQEWLDFAKNLLLGYTVYVFGTRWPFFHVQTLNHRWDIDECAERFSDMVGLPLESPPPSPENIDFVAKTPRGGKDEDKPLAKRRKRISGNFASLSFSEKQQVLDQLSRKINDN